MPFTIDNTVGPRVKKALLKKYKDLAVAKTSAASHITNANNETYQFVVNTSGIHNQFATDLYEKIVNKFPIVTNDNRKEVEKELDEAIKLAYANLPTEKEARKAYENKSGFGT